MPSGLEYVNRLREEVHRTLAPHIKNVEEELKGLRTHILNSLDQIEQELGIIRQIQVRKTETALSDAVEEVNRRREEQMAFVAHFAHDLRLKETQEEILTLLLDGAHRFAPRIALFVVRGDQFVGWSSRGYSEETAARIGGSAFAQTESPMLLNAIEVDGLSSTSDIRDEPRLQEILQTEAAGPWHVFPMRAIRRPVAMVLASPLDSQTCDLESLCILMDVTGLCIENMALKILQEMAATSQPADVERTKPSSVAGRRPASIDDTPKTESPEQTVDAQESGKELSDRAESDEMPEMPSPPASGEEPPAVDATAAGLKVVQPAVKTREQQPTQSLAAASVGSVGEPAEDEKLHADARRFARLLVSEIKLYNEQRVIEGRQNRDTYVRLKRDIDRSREMYEKRVSPKVSRKIDYFHDEIIRILGENDPSTLGSDYPGPRVEA